MCFFNCGSVENKVLPLPKATPTFSLAPFQTLTPSLPKSRLLLCRKIVSPNSAMHILPRCWEILQTTRENTLERWGKNRSKNARHSWFASRLGACIRHQSILKEEASSSMGGLAAGGVGVPGTNLKSLHCCCRVRNVFTNEQTENRRADVVVRK